MPSFPCISHRAAWMAVLTLITEGQADVAIRGGIFENTGFKIGAISLYDPQTGHYLAEIPIASAMLLSPQVLTGADNALAGFNAGVGTVAFGWRPIEQRGEASVAVGDYATNRQSLYQGVVLPAAGGLTIAADADLSRSESDGSVPFGDHNFRRASGRLQLRGAQSQTDFFAGYQAKFFGWPNLYTPFKSDETENLKTLLVALNHRADFGGGDYLQAGAYYRRNVDDYRFNRFAAVGPVLPFFHTTWTRGAALDGHQTLGDYAVAFSVQAMRDSLKSTSLTFGRFHTRDYLKVAVVPEHEIDTTDGKLKLRAGATYDETNHDGSAFSPIVVAELTRPGGGRLYAQYTESTQVPTYTALNSNAAAGLFRGNPNLGRETSRNLEAGAAFKNAGWTVETALFYRWDNKLADWTFRQGVTARTANAVDIGTFGLEVVASHKSPRCDLVFGYTFLDKNADYGAAVVDASFYALNFAKHRLTAAVVLRLGAGFEVRLDNEFRVQEKNLLRVIGGNDAVLSAAGLYYLPPRLRGLEFSLLVDNLWDSDFQDVPAVPAARRQFSAGAAYRW